MSDMIDVQRVLVAEHIARLYEEAREFRAMRDQPRRIARAASPRVRFGRWLVAVGNAVAGQGRPADDDTASLARSA